MKVHPPNDRVGLRSRVEPETETKTAVRFGPPVPISDVVLLKSFATPRKVADVCKKDVWEFQAKSGSSGSCLLFLHFLGKIAVRKLSGRTPGSPRHPSSRHPRPSEHPILLTQYFCKSTILAEIFTNVKCFGNI